MDDNVFDSLYRLESFAVCFVLNQERVFVPSVASLALGVQAWRATNSLVKTVFSFFLTTFNVFLGPIVQAEPSKAPQMFSLEPREAATAKQIAFAVSSAFTICLHESFHCSAEV